MAACVDERAAMQAEVKPGDEIPIQQRSRLWWRCGTDCRVGIGGCL